MLLQDPLAIWKKIYGPFYLYEVPLFHEEKEAENYFTYKNIEVERFKGLKRVSLNFSRNDLVLLLGLNESGKTSILKAIECFDFNNDPPPEKLKQFFTSVRNKQDIDCNTPTVITADIEFSQPLDYEFFKKAIQSATFDHNVKSDVDSFVNTINNRQCVRIARVIPFANGNAGKSFYRIEGYQPLAKDKKLSSILAQEIVRRSPYIIYFEDFQDLIPEKIFTNKKSDAYDPAWYEIIDAIFFNTNKDYNIKKYLSYYSKSNPRHDDARTVLTQVNNTLQDTFTRNWKHLSGVKEIESTAITFQESRKYFEIKITEKDGTTFSVHERSKGAVWYLAFLMKTEFRRKKLREGSGKPIYLIDEPASNLHSTAQTNMVGDFQKLVEDTTVIYTTHSQYLISKSNVRNTYIVKRRGGAISCVKWSEYIKGKNPKISYYQPLYDCLQIVPNDCDIPWKKAIITEGPTDSMTLELMQSVLEQKPTHVIYPGTSASKLTELISLNIGWGAKFKIMLDSDEEGNRQKGRYMSEFKLPEEQFVMLPEDHKEIEKLFDKQDLCRLYNFALGEEVNKLSKQQYFDMIRVLRNMSESKRREMLSLISEETKNRFAQLFRSLKSEVQTS